MRNTPTNAPEVTAPMPRTDVRATKVTRNGRTHRRQAHTRRTRLQPRRAFRNVRRSRRAFKKNRNVAGAIFATAAVSELAAFTVARSVGGVLFVIGAGLGILGYGMWKA